MKIIETHSENGLQWARFFGRWIIVKWCTGEISVANLHKGRARRIRSPRSCPGCLFHPSAAR